MPCELCEDMGLLFKIRKGALGHTEFRRAVAAAVLGFCDCGAGRCAELAWWVNLTRRWLDDHSDRRASLFQPLVNYCERKWASGGSELKLQVYAILRAGEPATGDSESRFPVEP